MVNVWTNGASVLNGKTVLAQSIFLKDTFCSIVYYSESNEANYRRIDFDSLLGRVVSDSIKVRADCSHPDYNLITITATNCFNSQSRLTIPQYLFNRFHKKKIVKIWQGSEAEKIIFPF